MARLQRGEHLVLCGPRGSGKTTLLCQLHARLERSGIPCALSPDTAHLNDITRALSRAYPEVDTTDMARRQAQARLRLAADHHEGVLLLDHVTTVSTAMIGFLRRLRGGIAGVVLAIDVEKESDWQHLRRRQLGTATLAMPPYPAAWLRRLFRRCCNETLAARISHAQELRLLQAARGRPGWIIQCARLIAEERYWSDATLHVSLLCIDTEILLRTGRLDVPPAADR
jgi:predicted ATPase